MGSKHKKQTKQDRILTHLQSNGSITPMQALEYYGSFRLSAIIFNLKKEGHDITTSIVPKKGYAKYTYNAS